MNISYLKVFAVSLGLACGSSVSAASDLQGQDGSKVLASATTSDRLYDMSFEGDEGVAVGENGLIMRTSDGGLSWELAAAPTSLALHGVARAGSREVAVGQLGTILQKEGESGWRVIESGTKERLLAVDINTAGLAIAVGAFGTLLQSTDGGQSWSTIDPGWADLYDSGSGITALIRDEPTNYVAKVFEEGRIIIGGEYGQLMESTDRGASWQVIYRHEEDAGESIAPTLFGISFSEQRGYAVGQAGLVIVSDDEGHTWRPLARGIQANLFAVTAIGNDKVIAIGQRSAVASTNGGRSWRQLNNLDVTLNWYSALGNGPAAGNRVAAAGHSGRIISLVPFE